MTGNVYVGRRMLLGAGAAAMAAPALLSGKRAMAEEKKDEAVKVVKFPPDVHRFKVGDFEVTVIKDGGRASGAPSAIFGTD